MRFKWQFKLSLENEDFASHTDMAVPPSWHNSEADAFNGLAEFIGNDCVSVVVTGERYALKTLIPRLSVSGVLKSVLSDPLIIVTSALGVDFNNCYHSSERILVPLVTIDYAGRP